MTYTQGGINIVTPNRGYQDWRGHNPAFTDINLAVEWLRALAHQFDGIEVSPINYETPAGVQNARLVFEAVKRVSEERLAQGKKPFVAYFTNPRLPGFTFHRRPSNPGWTPPPDGLFPLVDEQPVSYRGKSLKSDGSLHIRWPPPIKEAQSVISFSGYRLDITNEEAVTALLNNIRRLYRVSCADQNCIGPIYGFMAPSEWKLADLNTPFSKNADDRDLVYTNPVNGSRDPMVAHPELQTEHPCANGNRLKWPQLSSGNPCDLFTDQDIRYSFFYPPLRGIPLYSVSAKNSFMAYLSSIGKASLTNKLPADRSEFNQEGATLPSHVKFVGRSTAVDKEIWRHWENWVYKTHHGFLRRVFQAVADVQAGNPHYKGVMFFQYPIWFSMRQRSQSPVTFTYNTANGYRQETLTLAQQSEYAMYDHPSTGLDLPLLLQDPNVKGFLFESTLPLPQFRFNQGTTLQEKENAARFSMRHKLLVMARGKMAKEITVGAGRFFGVFQRYKYFAEPAPLPPGPFEDVWSDVIPILEPHLISTLPAWYYIRPQDVPPHLRYLLPINHPALGSLYDIWRSLVQAYGADF